MLAKHFKESTDLAEGVSGLFYPINLSMPELEGRVAEEEAPPPTGPSYIISSLSMDKDKMEPCSDSVL